METLAYLHLVEDFQTSENKTLTCNLSETAGKAAIGLTGMACTVSVLGATNAAFACSYSSEHDSSEYYSYESSYPSDYPSEYDSSCGCDQSQQSYYPDYSHDYSYEQPQQSYYPDYSDDYSYYSPVGYPGPGPNIVSPGASGPLIATLQAALADRGYYAGPIDGAYGPGTFDAVAQYQIERGLAVDGVAGGQTLDSLGLAG